MKRLIIATAVLIGLGSIAYGHGTAAWIMNNPNTAHCCSEVDCQMDMASDVVPEGLGWRVKSTGQFFSQKAADVYPSQDSHFWTCRIPANRLSAESGRTQHMVRCLFVPAQS